MGSWTPELLNVPSSPCIFFWNDNFWWPSFALLPLVLIQKLSSIRANHIAVIFNIFLTLVSRVWLSETASALITFCATGQSDEHSRQAVLNKIEQLHVDAQDAQLPRDALPQPLRCGYLPFRSYQVMQESRLSKWLTTKKLPWLLSSHWSYKQECSSERGEKIKHGRGGKAVLRITGSYLSTLSYKKWFQVNGRIIKITERSLRSSKWAHSYVTVLHEASEAVTWPASMKISSPG